MTDLSVQDVSKRRFARVLLLTFGQTVAIPYTVGFSYSGNRKTRMNAKMIAAIAATLLSAASVQAAEYACRVYCNGGQTTVVIQASSASDAAKKIDPTPVANQICQQAGKGNASSSTMSSNQCSAK